VALTVSAVYANGPISVGDRWQNLVSIAFDNSYATGGEALTPNDLGFASTTDPEFEVNTHPTSGFTFEYDYTNQKLIARTPLAVFTATYDPASLAATTSRDDAITVTGVASTDEVVRVEPPAAIAASVVVQGARVTGTDTITVRLTNASAGAVDVASGTWKFYVTGANGARREVPASTDLSTLTGVRVLARGAYRL